jgi:hypothetical protein
MWTETEAVKAGAAHGLIAEAEASEDVETMTRCKPWPCSSMVPLAVLVDGAEPERLPGDEELGTWRGWLAASSSWMLPRYSASWPHGGAGRAARVRQESAEKSTAKR